jgi:hypothetical protein
MLYRATREVEDKLDVLERHLRAALLADDTRTISAETAAAQALTVEILDRLKTALARVDDGDPDHRFIQAAVNCLSDAWNNAEKVGLGASAAEMRARLIDFKTPADYAAAYLRMAIGYERT